MKKMFAMFAMFMFLTGCGKGNDEGGGADVQKSPGMFSGSVAGNEYKVEVSCSSFDKDYFQFNSDRTDVTDTNGDGIIISGMETGGKFTLAIIDNGKTFSVGRLENFTKGDNKAEGSGQLFEEATSDAHAVEFSVVCP